MASNATNLLIWGFVAHLVSDWLFQNDWMARNKGSLVHPAAWVHGAICAAALLVVFPAPMALVLGVAHMLIDTRRPLNWWWAVIGKIRDESPLSLMVAMWGDQVMHIALIAVAARIVFPVSLL